MQLIIQVSDLSASLAKESATAALEGHHFYSDTFPAGTMGHVRSTGPTTSGCATTPP